MTTVLEGVRVQRHAPAALYPGKDPVPIVQEAGWAPGPVWTGAENVAPPPGFDPRTVQPVASRYTDYATRPTRKVEVLRNHWRCGSVGFQRATHVTSSAVPHFVHPCFSGKASLVLFCWLRVLALRTWHTRTGCTTDSRLLGRASASNRFVPDKLGGHVAGHYGCRELVAAYCAFNPNRLRCNALSTGSYLRTFRTIMQSPFSGCSSPVCELCENRTEFRNVDKRLPVHAEF